MKKFAFTLSEVLITLAIIGVVAALTIPSVVKNYQKHVTVTKLKKVYTQLNQVVIKSGNDNGSMSYIFELNSSEAVKEYFSVYWLDYFKFSKILNSYPDTSTPYKFLNDDIWGTGVHTNYYEKRLLFCDSNGVIYFIQIYNNTSINVYVDLNGYKTPNTYGKDIFSFKIDLNKNILVPQGYSSDNTDNNCNDTGNCCAAKIIKDGWQIKSDYPW